VICVEVKSQSGNVFTGTEGGSVDIYCKYPDGYQYASMYFCRDPCGYFDVLIEIEKADKVISKGRYSILNTVSARSTSVTIKNLRLGDSGVYYCGVDKWGKDIFSKVVVSVRKVTSTSAASSLSPLQTTNSTELSNATTHINTDNSFIDAQASGPTDSSHTLKKSVFHTTCMWLFIFPTVPPTSTTAQSTDSFTDCYS
ncbi:hypothetical protein NFI96_027617, partial [Prochilodus magdalenae]